MPVVITQIDFDQILRIAFTIAFICGVIVFAYSVIKNEINHNKVVTEKNNRINQLEKLSDYRRTVNKMLRKELAEERLKYKALEGSNDAHS